MWRVTSALFAAMAGMVCAVLGLALGLWIVLVNSQPDRVRGWIFRVTGQSPVDLEIPPDELAGYAMHVNAQVLAGAGSLLLLALAFSYGRSARRCFDPENASDDGKALLVLSPPLPQVGRPLTGKVQLVRWPATAVKYELKLSCVKRHGTGSKGREGFETLFSSTREVTAVLGGRDCSLPFRFEIPVTLPAPDGRDISWQLTLRPLAGWFASSSNFALKLAPAPVAEVQAAVSNLTDEQRQLIAGLEEVNRERLRPDQIARIQGQSAAEVARNLKTVRGTDKGMRSCLVWIVIVFVLLFVSPFLLFLVGAVWRALMS